jgi:hypothetical protein
MTGKPAIAAILAALLAVPLCLAAVMTQANGSDNAVSGLPHSGQRSFATLDAYLAHLERGADLGIVWYRLRPDGRYDRVGRGGPEVHTRQDLAQRFGFDE